MTTKTTQPKEMDAPRQGDWRDADPAILPLVEALNALPWLATLSSCSGHRTSPPYIDLAIKKTHIREFVALLNAMTASEGEDGYFLECLLNWNEGVATGCMFDEFPGLLMFSLQWWPVGMPEGRCQNYADRVTGWRQQQ